MKKISALLVLVILIFSSISFAQEEDKEGSKDHPLLSRIPGYYISDQINKDFDVYTSPYIETDNVCLSGTEILNCPSRFVTVPLVVPFSTIVAPINGTFKASFTVPVTVICCAYRQKGKNKAKKAIIIFFLKLFVLQAGQFIFIIIMIDLMTPIDLTFNLKYINNEVQI